MNTRKTRLCIFVVEDDHSVPGLINTVLENWCYHLGMARNGRECLDAVMNMQSTEFLLDDMDMHMPMMNGQTLTR
ncbi:MAG: hypothetical protein R3B95_07305 [Nitrospirales bacterium]|nr:hypothetical protein [Nitrospirales bacterium]